MPAKCYKCGSKDIVGTKFINKASLTNTIGKNYHIYLCKKCFDEDLNADEKPVGGML